MGYIHICVYTYTWTCGCVCISLFLYFMYVHICFAGVVQGTSSRIGGPAPAFAGGSWTVWLNIWESPEKLPGNCDATTQRVSLRATRHFSFTLGHHLGHVKGPLIRSSPWWCIETGPADTSNYTSTKTAPNKYTAPGDFAQGQQSLIKAQKKHGQTSPPHRSNPKWPFVDSPFHQHTVCTVV